MLEVIEKLLILQDRDRNIFRIKEELAHIEPERRTFREKSISAQAALETAKLKVKQLESDRKTLELEVEGHKQKIEKYSIQQFQTKKNEEFRAIGHEIDNCKAAIVKLEDRQIEIMEQIETAQKEAAALAKAAGEAQKLTDEQLAGLAERETNLNQTLANLSADRETLASAVDPLVRSRYERLFKSKGGNVVVGIPHGVCGGCHMKFPPQVVLSCRRDEEIVNCPNCGRILYYTPDMNMDPVD